MGMGPCTSQGKQEKNQWKKKKNKKIINTCCLASGCYLIWFQGRAQPGQDARAVPELCVCFQQQLCCLLRLEKASRWPLGVQKHITEYADKDERCQEVGNQVWKVPQHWYVGRRTELHPAAAFLGTYCCHCPLLCQGWILPRCRLLIFSVFVWNWRPWVQNSLTGSLAPLTVRRNMGWL